MLIDCRLLEMVPASGNLDYRSFLADMRMTLAANALEKSEISTRAAAELVGHESVAATHGNHPGAWR